MKKIYSVIYGHFGGNTYNYILLYYNNILIIIKFIINYVFIYMVYIQLLSLANMFPSSVFFQCGN